MKIIKTAQRLNYFPEYVFSRLEKTVKEVERESNRKVLSFAAGTPDVKPDKTYLEKFCGFMHEPDAHLYPGYGASEKFSNALMQWYLNRFKVSLAGNELYPLLGAKDGISHLPLALLNEGDEVLTPDPGYPGFTGPVLMTGAKPIFYDLIKAKDYKIDLNELKRKVSKKTKFIWVNYPSNPTGQVITKDGLIKIVGFAQEHGLFIVYDNAYSEITFDGYVAPSILQIEGAKEISVEIGSFSKTFSFAGFRMGWIAGNKDIIAALAKIKSQTDSGLFLPLQKLGAYALTNFDHKWYREMIASYKKRRDIIAKYMQSLGLEFTLPKGGLYLWAKIPDTSEDAEEYCAKLLKEKQIMLTPGTAFGKNGIRYVRISICVNIDKIDKYF